jgi:hypothetical protein
LVVQISVRKELRIHFQQQQNNKMPSATTTKAVKSAMASAKSTGSKRKEYPVREKHLNDRDSKKARTVKTTTDTKILKPALKSEKSTLSKKPKDVMAVSLDEDSESSDSDGGVPLDSSEPEDIVTPADGLHPDRLKAVITNSKLLIAQLKHTFVNTDRSIVERSACEAKATCQGEKGCEAYGGRSGQDEKDLGAIAPKITCPEG